MPRKDMSPFVSSGSVRRILKAGGRLEFKAINLEVDIGWEVFIVDDKGARRQVMLAQTFEPKVFYQANSIINYYRRMCPGATELTLPLLPDDSD